MLLWAYCRGAFQVQPNHLLPPKLSSALPGQPKQRQMSSYRSVPQAWRSHVGSCHSSTPTTLRAWLAERTLALEAPVAPPLEAVASALYRVHVPAAGPAFAVRSFGLLQLRDSHFL